MGYDADMPALFDVPREASAPPRVLVVDDESEMLAMIAASLPKSNFAVVPCGSAAEALDRVRREDFDAVLTDVRMRAMDGISLCQRISETRPDTPVVVMTAFGTLETAVAAMRAGAYDFLTKPFEPSALELVLMRAVQHRALRAEVRRLRQALDGTRQLGSLVGHSPAMQAVRDLIDRIADSDASVLITGESGTGKEVAAREIHARSRRRSGPFVAINCAAMPEALLESELFGHVRGAFTDARATRKGLFLQASGGTVFLDEIGEMPIGLQPKLLRALQERKIRPVGGDTETAFDARVIAATNRDLETAVEERGFRADLYFRLNVIQVEMPALRSRGSDVLLLAQQFLERFATEAAKDVRGFSPDAAKKLVAYSWPGNVRELQNCIERAVALTRFDTLTVDDLPEKIRDYKSSHVIVAADDPAELVPMEEVERRYILRVLDATRGNKSQAARILGFDRKTLYRKLERYGVAVGSEDA